MSVESLFFLHRDWEVLPLGEVCRRGGGNIQTGPFGSQLHASDYVVDGIPSVMPQNIGDNKILDTGIARITQKDADRLAKYRMREGDIVYSRRGDVERRALVRNAENGWLCGTGCLRIRFGNKVVYPKYAAHYLGHPSVREWIVRHAHGATMPNLNTTILSELPFVLPQWDVQVLIGDLIEAYDQKIALNRRINETLEAMAQAIFKSWFVDFDPVKAKIAAKNEGRDPLRAAMSAISGKSEAELQTLPPESYHPLATTAALFPDEMETSELGEIPRGWGISDMRSLAEVISKGTTPNKSDIATAKDAPIIPFVKVKDITETGEITRGNLEYIARSIHESSLKRSILKTDDLLFSIAGTIGRTAFVDHDLNRANVNQAIAFIRLKDKASHFSLCWFTLRNIETQNFVASKVVQAVQANASLANVGDIPVKLPCNDLIEKWNDVVGSLLLEYRTRQAEMRTLASLRDTLLPKLLSGELSVQDVDETDKQ